MDDMQKAFIDMIRIAPDYQYHEPKKGGISIKHIAIALVIGFFVYGFITLLSKKRAKR